MSESYALVSFIFASSLVTFLENVFYIIVFAVLIGGMLWFMERHKMFDPKPKRRRFRRR